MRTPSAFRARTFVYGAGLVTAIALAPAGAASQAPPREILAQADRSFQASTRVTLEASIEEYARAADAARAQGLRDVEARALLGRGTALSLLARGEEAEPFLAQAGSIFTAIGDLAGKAEAQIHHTGVTAEAVGTEKAIGLYREAIGLARQVGDRRVEALGLDYLGWVMPVPELWTYEEKYAALGEAVAIRRTLPNRWDLAMSLCGLAYVTKDGEEGRRLLEEALAVSEAAGALRPMGFALSLLAGHHNQAGDLDRALEFLDRATVLNRESGNRRQEPYTLESAAHIYYARGMLREALASSEQALAGHRALKNHVPEGYLLQIMGTILSSLGDQAGAIERLDQALAITRLHKDRESEGLTLLSVAAVRGDPLIVLELSRSALAAFQDVKAEGRQMGALMWMSSAYSSLGRYREAVETLGTALEIAARLGATTLETTLQRMLGATYVTIGDHRQALDHLGRARALAVKAGNDDEMVVSMSHMASVRLALGEPAAALELLDAALPIARKSQRSVVEARVLDALARHALATNRPQAALQFYEQGLSARRRAGDIGDEPFVLVGIGEAHAAAGNRAAALDSFRRALASSRATRKPPAEALALVALMRWSNQAGERGAAVFYGKLAVNMFQEARADLRQLDPTVQRAYVDARAGTYRELADVLIADGRLPEAQQVLNLLKEQEFFDFIRRDAGERTAEGQVSMTARETAVRAPYDDNGARLAAIGRQRGELLARQKRSAEEDRQLDDLDGQVLKAGAEFAKLLDRLPGELAPEPGGATKLAAIRDAQALMADLRELKHDAVALYTVVANQRYHVILITPDVILSGEHAIAARELNRKVLAFRQALEDPRSDPRPLAEELYRILVAPIAGALEGARARTLMWVLDGTLRYLPVAALHDGRGYLAERFHNTVFTPASHPRLKDEPSRRWTGLGAGVSKAHGDFSALPAVSEELRGIFRSGKASGNGVIEGQVLLDEAFTADTFRRSLRQRVPLVHVATHFQFRPGNETDSFLLLGDGSRLTLADLRLWTGLFGGVELLTLSACSTAAGDSGAEGTEIEGAGILAQRNGAKAVIASLWSVADASTRVFMEQFYRARQRRGATKASALRDAQLALLHGAGVSAPGERRGVTPGGVAAPSSRAPYAHPYYWAPFILIGNWK